MKKVKILKCFAIIFAVVFCFSSLTATASSEKTISIPAPTDRSEEFYVTQAESIRVYNDLLDSFNSVKELSKEQIAEKQEYPDYYGGAYIDTSTGKLVVMMRSEKSIQTLQRTYSAKSTNITYEFCDVSYNQLRTLYDAVNAKLEFFSAKNIEIVSASIDVQNQEVFIEVLGLTGEKEKIIRETLPEAYLSVGTSSQYQQPCSFGPGCNAIDSTGNRSTIGFAATRNGTGGFVIAGHAGYVGEEFTSGGTTLGEITHSSFRSSSTADAAFITAESGLILTYELVHGGDIWNATTSRLPQNTLIYKYGSETNLTSGRITAETYTIRYDIDGQNYRFTNCVKADYYSEHGDSGGPVMIYEGNYGGASKYTLCGIHSALRTSGNTFSYSAYTPYSNIVNELGVSCIVGS